MNRILAPFLALFALPALGQTVQQSGNVTPGHVTSWITDGVIGDGGPLGGGASLSGTYTAFDFLCADSTSLTPLVIDCGLSATGTNTWNGFQIFSGGATAPTQALGNNTTNLATTAFVQTAIGSAGAVGMIGDGTTDNATVFQALLAAAGSSGGSISLPCGNFVIKSATTLTVASTRAVTVQGRGQCTILSFQGTNATAITLADVFASIHWAHMRMTTDGAGTRTGLAATLHGNPIPIFSEQHIFEDLLLTGSDWTNPVGNYWSTGLRLAGLSNVQIDNVTSIGVPGVPSGVGVLIQGFDGTCGSGGPIAVIGNFKNYASVYNATGILYGECFQGVSVVASNFNSGTNGIALSGAGLSQLTVVNSQFGENVTAGINISSSINLLSVSNSVFETSGTSQVGINGLGQDGKIVGNTFLGLGGSAGTGIALTTVGGSGAWGVIANNTFNNLPSGIKADSGTLYQELTISHNIHIAMNTRALYNFTGGENLFIDDNQPASVADLPTCNSSIVGSTFTVVDNNTAVAYRGAVTTGGTLWGRVFCPSTGAWVQN